MDIVDRIQSFVAGEQRVQDRDAAVPPSTSLYRCSTCERTFVTDSEMEVCERCGDPVSRTPTGAELDFL
ncbi:hypothetical protein ACAH01_16090 (plasmid) [Halomicrobium sp. HM KBTZ05]|uniref:hypothetical protein n=1 Tax=Halomicrobium sp. HM KBTZ05 TaxID=3242663 RepID=UPI0035575871